MDLENKEEISIESTVEEATEAVENTEDRPARGKKGRGRPICAVRAHFEHGTMHRIGAAREA